MNISGIVNKQCSMTSNWASEEDCYCVHSVKLCDISCTCYAIDKINNLCRLWRNCIRSYIGDHAKASLSMKLISFAGNVAIEFQEPK